ncbi:MAG: hypothetical protein H0S85_11235 [Desulfovibrionaceae bacterium]|jgi:hypothetical protein|nr:hypothetical protein [Desulfovibrionaceae bacterium]
MGETTRTGSEGRTERTERSERGGLPGHALALAGAAGAAFLVLLALAVLVVRCADLTRNEEYTLRDLHHFSIKGAAYDVVLVGDSALATQIDPAVLRELTGLSAVNLALNGNSGLAGYRLLIDEYLANNAAPRALVLYFSYANPRNMKIRLTFEKTYTLLRHAPLTALPGYLLDGELSLGSVFYTARNLVLNRPDPHAREYLEMLERNRGYGSAHPCARPVADDYAAPFVPYSDEDVAYMVRLRDRYLARGVETRLYIAAEPRTLAKDARRYDALFGPLGAPPIETLPNDLFCDASHMTHAGARAQSERFARDFLAPLFGVDLAPAR